ncbi:AT-rich interactive domain-containing protein 1A isoform X3 [Haplochromis burtoni]|uniref:AT-rich interactive domain-containing protein 1A isoform X3 n=1 Tax=Haplochromis burtoni TaxID=8153 RepID=UPI001C2CF937|nr:AT-rich interactive domain-containing protein 1A isoform X3 [Haplochromis burtoni]
MASGPCVRVLLLSLLAFSKHAEALTYRRSYSSVIKPYFGKPEDFPHNQYPVSRHKSYAQPRSSLGVYGPENGSPESSYPTAAGLPGGAGASSGRPLNGYLQQESMSSYRSGSSQPHKPSYYQGDTDGALQSKDAMWGLAPSQKRNWIDAGIVSSYPIEMRSVPQRPSNEHQTQPHDKQEQFSDESSMFQSRPQPRPLPQQPRYEASKPQARPFPQQPRYEASKLHAQPLPFPQQPRYEASKLHAQVQPEREQLGDESSKFQPRPFPQQPRYEASKPQAQPQPFPQQPRYEASKLHAQVQPEREQLGDESSKFQPRPFPQQPRYEASKPQAQPRPFPQQPRYEASKPQAQPRPFPQQPRYEASKPQAQPRPFPQQPRYEASKPQAQPRPFPQQPRYEASKPQAQPLPFPQQPRYKVSKLQGSEANSPSGGVLQTKSGMWDLADPRSFRPIPVSLRNLYRWPQQQAPIYNRC